MLCIQAVRRNPGRERWSASRRKDSPVTSSRPKATEKDGSASSGGWRSSWRTTHRVWKRNRKIFPGRMLYGAFWPDSFWENGGGSGYPPPPPPLESLDWRGFCKNGLQNLERLEVRGQNIDNKAVMRFFSASSFTAFASAIICLVA